jgi:hypothetical protein
MRSRGPLGEWVTFQTASGLNLDGILYQPETSGRTTLVHVHGSFGNFYQNQFVRVLAARCLERGVNLLSFNTSAHDGVAEGYGSGEDFRYVGGSLVTFGESVADIEAAVRFASGISECVVLQGHSLGCDRVVNYLLKAGTPHDCILLAPCDSYRLQANLRQPETVEHQIARLRKDDVPGEVFPWLPVTEYGIRAGEGWTYPNPITRTALLSILEGPPFQLFRFDGLEKEWRLPQRALICVGGRDALQTTSAETVFQFFRHRFESIDEVLLAEGDHMMKGSESVVSDRIICWLTE